jgi:hypothetical protein
VKRGEVASGREGSRNPPVDGEMLRDEFLIELGPSDAELAAFIDVPGCRGDAKMPRPHPANQM